MRSRPWSCKGVAPKQEGSHVFALAPLAVRGRHARVARESIIPAAKIGPFKEELEQKAWPNR